MDLVDYLAELETNDTLHEARLLLILAAFSDSNDQAGIEGLTKLAKLDFLLRYPKFLERALDTRRRSTRVVKIQPYERESVESRMVRYKYGPWDHRYYRFLNLLIAKGLAHLKFDGKAVKIGLTPQGIEIAQQIAKTPPFSDITRRSKILKTHFNLTGTYLKNFIYKTFPEIVSLRIDEVINP